MLTACTSCGAGAEATSWCVDCGEALCRGCVEAHKRVKVTRSHHILDQLPADVPRSDSAPTGIYCPLHREELLQLYCYTCDVRTCRDCQLMDHRAHSFQFVHEAYQSIRKQMYGLLVPVDKHTEKAMQSIMLMSSRLKEIHSQKVEMKVTFLTLVKSFCLHFKERLSNHYAQVAAIYTSEEEVLKTRMKGLMEKVEDYTVRIKKLEDDASDIKTLLARKTEISAWSEWILSQEVGPPKTMTKPSLTINTAVVKAILSLGELRVSQVPFACKEINPQEWLSQPPGDQYISRPANRRPANRRPANRRPANRRPANRRPANRRPANRRPANRRPANRRPANRRPANRRPANRTPANRRPANRRPANRRPANRRPANRRPANRRPGNRRPANRRPANRRPANRTPANRRPANRRPANRRPANRRPANRRPANRRPANRTPANRTPANRRPANRTPANRRPANRTPANRRPANRTPANRRPANRRPANRRPASRTPANSRPANSRPANRRPSNSRPANRTPANRRPANRTPANRRPANRRPSNSSSALLDRAFRAPAIIILGRAIKANRRQDARPLPPTPSADLPPGAEPPTVANPSSQPPFCVLPVGTTFYPILSSALSGFLKDKAGGPVGAPGQKVIMLGAPITSTTPTVVLDSDLPEKRKPGRPKNSSYHSLCKQVTQNAAPSAVDPAAPLASPRGGSPSRGAGRDAEVPAGHPTQNQIQPVTEEARPPPPPPPSERQTPPPYWWGRDSSRVNQVRDQNPLLYQIILDSFSSGSRDSLTSDPEREQLGPDPRGAPPSPEAPPPTARTVKALADSSSRGPEERPRAPNIQENELTSTVSDPAPPEDTSPGVPRGLWPRVTEGSPPSPRVTEGASYTRGHNRPAYPGVREAPPAEPHGAGWAQTAGASAEDPAGPETPGEELVAPRPRPGKGAGRAAPGPCSRAATGPCSLRPVVSLYRLPLSAVAPGRRYRLHAGDTEQEMFLEEIEDDDLYGTTHSTPAGAQYGTTHSSPAGAQYGTTHSSPAVAQYGTTHSSPAVAQYGTTHSSPAVAQYGTTHSSPAVAQYGTTHSSPAVAQYGTTHSSPAVAQYGTTHSSPAVAQYGTTQGTEELTPVPSVLQPSDEEQDSYLQPLSSPGSPEGPPAPGSLAVCACCHAPSCDAACSRCERSFHGACHVPPGALSGPEWVCSLCQDLSDPGDPYASERSYTPCLSLLEQRKCECVLLSLLCQLGDPTEALAEVQKRLCHLKSPPYRTSLELITDLQLAVDLHSPAEDGVPSLWEGLQLTALLGVDPDPSLRDPQQPAGGPGDPGPGRDADREERAAHGRGHPTKRSRVTGRDPRADGSKPGKRRRR
ncbi:unnamed protein product [Arctogadus glacialis]